VERARVAADEDLETVVELARRSRALVADERGGALWIAWEATREPLGDAFDAYLGDDAAALFVGLYDEAVVGFAACSLVENDGGRHLTVLDELFVDPEARSVGVGEALIDAVRAWSAERGSRGIDASALPGDRASKNFFETMGFTARLLVMHQPIG
jgi:GNAT superfamily N-acetyltransferase